MSVTVIVPTFNESPNVEPLVTRIATALASEPAEVLFVDDSTDDTPDVVAGLATHSVIPLRLIHRLEPVGGLSGAVIEGLGAATSEFVVVMDGDLQHPPEVIPTLLAKIRQTDADLVVASRYVDGGTNSGLSNLLRHLISRTSGALTKAMFPIRLRNVSDPMTGFFAVRRASVDVAGLQPRGFKILLEILARQPLLVTEVPFDFGKRVAGESKATVRQGLRFIRQLGALRFGRLSRFAVIGAFGTVLNLLIMAWLLAMGTDYIPAAIVAAAITILRNFFLQGHFAFQDLRNEGKPFWVRFVQAVGFNTVEAAVRTVFLWVIVEYTPIPPLVSQAVTLAIAFLLRFLFQARVVYRPRRSEPTAARPRPRRTQAQAGEQTPGS